MAGTTAHRGARSEDARLRRQHRGAPRKSKPLHGPHITRSKAFDLLHRASLAQGYAETEFDTTCAELSNAHVRQAALMLQELGNSVVTV